MGFFLLSTNLAEDGMDGGLRGHKFWSRFELVLGDLSLMLDVDLVNWASAVGGRTNQLEREGLC
jgi:hypothetical protein